MPLTAAKAVGDYLASRTDLIPGAATVLAARYSAYTDPVAAVANLHTFLSAGGAGTLGARWIDPAASPAAVHPIKQLVAALAKSADVDALVASWADVAEMNTHELAAAVVARLADPANAAHLKP